MEIGEYTIRQFNELNLVLEKRETRTALKDSKTLKKGESYEATAFKGYYGSMKDALRAILKVESLEWAGRSDAASVIESIDRLELVVLDALKDAAAKKEASNAS